MYWELEDFKCFSGKIWEGGFIKINDESQQLIQAIGSKSFWWDNPIDGTGGKLGHGFTSTNELEEIDISPGDRPRPTYVSAKLDPEYKPELIDLLKEI